MNQKCTLKKNGPRNQVNSTTDTNGYKKHIGEDKNGIILKIHSVAANKYDSIGLRSLISKLRYNSREIYAEKGYQIPANVSYFHSLGIKYDIQKKSYRTISLSRIAILFKIISE
ncbi:MAG: transposase [Flavobacteriales bacterium Tduv]